MWAAAGEPRTLGLRTRNAEISADFLGEILVDFGVSGNCGCLSGSAVHVNRVVGSLSQQFAAVVFEMPDELAPLHPVIFSGSRMTPGPAAASRARTRFASSTNSTASRKFARASSSVAPCVLAPGSSSTNPI